MLIRSLVGLVTLPAVLGTTAALAQEPPRHVATVSAVGGADFQSNQLFAGAEFAVHPNQSRGFAGQFLVQPAYSISDNTGLLWLETGASVVVPYDDEPVIIRVGIWGRAGIPWVRYDLPVRLGETGTPGTGLVPAGGGQFELAWRGRTFKRHIDLPKAQRGWNPAAALGVRIGAGAEYNSCVFDEDILPDCATWFTALAFQGYSRIHLRNRLHIEARVGTQISLAIGGRLGPRIGEPRRSR